MNAKQTGFTLVETLVALIVLSVGLLGVAGLQIFGLRGNLSASSRTQATYFADDIIDRMRANYIVARGPADAAHLQYRPYPAARGKQRPFQNRDIQRMFEPLRITEQFLLKSQQREMLFRKAGETTPAAADA